MNSLLKMGAKLSHDAFYCTIRGDCSYQRAAGVEDGFDGGVAHRVAAAGGVNTLLLLTAVAEPDPDHLLLHVELVGDHGDLLRCRLLVLLEEEKEARDAM